MRKAFDIFVDLRFSSLRERCRSMKRRIRGIIFVSFQPGQDKRWVVVSPPGSVGTTLLLARASKPEQEAFIGNQTGGRVFLFLNSDDFWRDYNEMVSKGIKFVREPKQESYGMVAVFEDLYGNLWDLLELNSDHPIPGRIM